MLEIEKMKNDILAVFNDIRQHNIELEIIEYSSYYMIKEESYMWILETNDRGIRVFLSEKFGLNVEFGEETFGAERFWEKAKELNLSDKVFDTYDQLYPPQNVFEYKIQNFDVAILKDELLHSFQMR